MPYLLDTNICIELLRGRRPSVRRKFLAFDPADFFISIISYGELIVGAEKNSDPVHDRQEIAKLVETISVLPLLPGTAADYGRIRAYLEQRGQIIGANDLWIAAHAVSLQFTLVSENLREFRRVPDLKVENWVER
jgi:tRNA(fMet)-specific endonuclease VapC